MESIPPGDKPPRGQAEPKIPTPIHPLRPWLLALIFWTALIPLSARPRVSGNVWPRLMTAESLVERGTFAIEGSPMLGPSGTPDLAKIHGHTYADKPPVLSILVALVYAPLHLGLGWSFLAPGRGLRQFVPITWVLTSLLSAGGAAWALASTRRLLQLTTFRPLTADALTLALGFSTPLLTYAVTLNNHTIAAGLITAAMAAIALENPQFPKQGWAGVCAGLAATIDLPAGGATFAILAGWLILRNRSIPWAYALGGAGPALLHIVSQLSMSGSPLPFELDRRAMEYPGAYWTTPAGQFHESGPRWRFGLELLLGPQGWLTITPILLLTPIGLARNLRNGSCAPLARATTALLVVLLTFYIWGVARTDYAGLSFGVRHLLAVTPLAALFAVSAVDGAKNRTLAAVFLLLLAIGAAYAWVGMHEPWTRADGTRNAKGQRIPRPEPLLQVLQQLVPFPHTSYTRW